MKLEENNVKTLDALQALVASAEFRKDVDKFMDKYASEYQDLDLNAENKLCFTQHHEEFQVWAEAKLESAVPATEIAELCERLPDFVGGGSKEHVDSLEKYEKTLSILAAFTDFQQFRIMMQIRSSGRKNKSSAIVGLEHHEAGHTHVKDMLEVAKKLEDVTIDGKNFYAMVEQPDFKIYKGEFEDKRVMRIIVAVDLPWQQAVECFVTMSPEREKWDDQMVDIKQLSRNSDTDAVFQARLKNLPSLVRWLAGIPDPMAFRIVTDPISGKQGISYVCCAWDVEGDCISKKPDFKKSGVVKPHPDAPETKSIITAVEHSSFYLPDWVVAPFIKSQVINRFQTTVERFKKCKAPTT